MGSVAAVRTGTVARRTMASSDSLKAVPAVTERGEGDLVAGRYRLVRKVGSGGMGSVWYAQDLSLDAHCAIKLIDGEKANDEHIRLRFEREAKASAQLRSAHVVNVFDYGIWNRTQYLAMEYLDGEDLAVRLMRLGCLDGATTYRIIAHVARALMSAHAIGIVHRDLKPENIFLVQNYDEEIAKVLDFGIAQLDAYTLEDRATREGAFLGTPCYVSPEQARGRPIDHRSDLWSLGVIAFQCLTGRLPFEGTALGELMGQILYEPLPKPSRIDASLPKGIDEWWEHAAARNRENRFQSAKEMADQLGVLLGVESLVLVPTVPPRRRTSFPPAAEQSGVITAAPVPLAAVRTTAPAPESELEYLSAVAAFKSDRHAEEATTESSSTGREHRSGRAVPGNESHSEVDRYIALLAAEPLVSTSPQASTPEPGVIQLLEPLPRGVQESQVRFGEHSPVDLQDELQSDALEAEALPPDSQQEAGLVRLIIAKLNRIPRRWTVLAPLIAGFVVLCAIVVVLLKGRSSNLVAVDAQSQSPSHQAPARSGSLPAAGPSSSAETLTVDMLPLIKRKGHNAKPDLGRPADSSDTDVSKKAEPGSKQGPKTPRTPQPVRDYGI
jgi:serine/threonine protein kinase